MPARRKAPGTRVGHVAAPVVRLHSSAIVAPAIPEDWLPATVTAWEQFYSSDVCRAADVSDLAALVRMFGWRDKQAKLIASWEAEPYVDGSTGQPVVNPALARAEGLERLIIPLEDRFGLSPKARSQLGISLGHAKKTAADLNQSQKPLEVVQDDPETYEGFAAED